MVFFGVLKIICYQSKWGIQKFLSQEVPDI